MTVERAPIVWGPPAAIWRWTVLAGIVTGALYALSPLTVLVAVGCVPLFRWAVRDLEGFERRAVLTLMSAALALRVLAIVLLVLTGDRDAASMAKFFGDEEFFLLRAFRLYSIKMGIPVSTESFIYAYDATGYSSYQELLVLLQVIVGPVPYGIHLLNTLLFIWGMVLLFRTVRVSFGPAPALVGLAYLLFLPSLFMWSVSALKESLYLLLTSAVLLSAVAAIRKRGSAAKVVAVGVMLAGGWWLETLRVGGRAITLGGAAFGYLLRITALRRWTAALAVVVIIAGAGVIWRTGLPVRVQERLQLSARYHRGHVLTAGHSYKLLDQHFYSFEWGPMQWPTLTTAETARYLVRAPIHFILEPIPWRIQSRLELAYLPELAVWYIAVLLVPVGIVAGFRRDALLTCMLAGYSFVSAGVIALNSGNVGTLIRHRALVVPFLGWLSAMGLVSLALARRRERSRQP
jgi:hypothetical protein